MTDSQCGDNWQHYKDEKCVQIIGAQNTLSFDEAEKQCLQADNGSSLLTIHSKEEQDFISEFLFKTNKIVENVWLGLKKSSNNFKWSDGSNIDFTNWLTGNPSNETDHNCVQMLPESSLIGKWSDITCNKRNIAVCQKSPTISSTLLQKMLLETRETLLENKKELEETRKKLEQNILKSEENRKKLEENTLKFNKFLNNFANNKWMKFELFGNTDGKQKAFFIPSEHPWFGLKTWDYAVKVCASFNATLVEMDSSDKEFIFLSYLQQFSRFADFAKIDRFAYDIWLNVHKDSSGMWRWINSGKEFTSINWMKDYPKSDSGYDYLAMHIIQGEHFGKIWNHPKTDAYLYVVCEIDVNL